MSLIVSGGYVSSRIPNPGPITQIQPFTYEDGVTFVELLADIRRYIVHNLEPYLTALSIEIDERIITLIQSVDAALDAQTELVDEKLEAQDAANTLAIQALTDYVNAQVQLIIEDAIQVQDPVVAGMLEDEDSETRIVAEGLFANKATQETVVTGRLSATSLKASFDRRSVNNILDFGAVATPGVDNTTAIQSAINDCVATGLPMYVPQGVFECNALLWENVNGFTLNMDGRFKRPNNSPRLATMIFRNSQNIQFGAIRTEGNASNNLYEGYAVDEAKHDVRLDNVRGFTGDLLDSLNPSGDSIYIAGGLANNSSEISIATVSSKSDALTGRNAVSVIKGFDMLFGTINSINTGHPGSLSPVRIAMPGGLDIEPNLVTDVVDNISVGQVIVKTAGGAGFNIFATQGKIISNVRVDSVILTKLNAAITGTVSWIIRGVKNVTVGSIITTGNGVASGGNIDDAENVRVTSDIVNVGGQGYQIGATAAVTNLTASLAVDGCTGHGISVFALSNAVITPYVKNHGTAHAAINKSAAGTSDNVRFTNGDISKATKGALMVNVAAAVTNWIIEAVNCTGWGVDTRLKGANAIDVLTRNCPALNYLSAPPNFDGWKQGTVIWNSAPAAGAVPGWIATASGVGNTGAVFKAMGALAA